jgi:hypothetical protein
MRKLALEFGISDVGLAKICRKSGIPLPGLGDWRQVETGHPPEHKPLPASEPGQHETITIAARTPESHRVLRKTNIGPVPDVEVNPDREITHPLAIRTKRAFRATLKNERGMLVPAEVTIRFFLRKASRKRRTNLFANSPREAEESWGSRNARWTEASTQA